MGGCRCTFRNCENSTASKPGMHFFHFPIRDWPRLEQWAAFANKQEFKDLPLSKLKNKVVCEDHFANRMFMNYLKESLTKSAIPTLDVIADGRVWDLETNIIGEREEWVLPEKAADQNHSDPLLVPKNSQSTRMEIQFVEDEQKHNPDKPKHPVPTFRKGPIVLNKEAKAIKILSYDSESSDASSAPSNKILRKVVVKRKIATTDDEPCQSKLQALSIQRMKPDPIIVEAVSVDQTSSEDPPSVTTPSSSTDVATNKIPTPECKLIPVTDPVVLEKLDQNHAGIMELRELLVDVLSRPVPEPEIITVPVPSVPQAVEISSPKQDKGPNMNKVQLFNGIKRYLNPTMVALLRCEMFGGSADRQWKADEKALAVELLNLGDTVYDHFCDEFRFRLPSKQDVQKWKEQELDDDDAS